MKRLLVRDAAHVLTMTDPEPAIGGGDVVVEGPAIVEIVPAESDTRPDPGRFDDVIDARGMLVLPGLVNTHHHFFQTLTRHVPGLQDVPLFDWLVGHYPIWAGLTGEMIEAATRVTLAELLLTGCTTTADHQYLFPPGAPIDLIDRQVRAAHDLGIRFHPSRGSMETGQSGGGLPPDDLVEERDRILDDCRRLIDTVHDPDRYAMTRLALAPCAPFNVSEELLRETAALARARGVRLHTHLAETEDEVAYCLARYGVRPVAYAERLGWIESDVWLAHAVFVTDEEIARLGARGVGVAHCPSSNLRLGSGIAPVRRLLNAGVTVGIGVDGAASNDGSHLLAEVRQALLVSRARGERDAWLTAREALALATGGGAAVLGRDDVGSLAPGMGADLVLVDVRRVPYAAAGSDPAAALVLTAPVRPVHTVVVNGGVVVRDGELATADERVLVADARACAAALAGRTPRGVGLP